MRRFVCFCIICFSLLCFSFLGAKNQLSMQFEMCDIEVFCNTNKQSNLPFRKIKNGNGVVYFAKFEEQDFLINNIVGVEGITYILQGDFQDYCKLQSDLGIKNVETTSTSCVGYTNCFGFSTFYKGKKVNVQMCYSQNRIYVGSPLILGCY